VCVSDYVCGLETSKTRQSEPDLGSSATKTKCDTRQSGESRNLQLSPNAVTILCKIQGEGGEWGKVVSVG